MLVNNLSTDAVIGSPARRGPHNPEHKIYRQNHKKIQQEIFRAVANRDISVRVSQVCRKADITAPTFYLHYRNCNDVLDCYEGSLLEEFRRNLSRSLNHETTFHLLLIFIYQHRQYFRASFRGRNFYAMAEILRELRPVLARRMLDDRVYMAYAANVVAHIAWWGIRERFSRDAIPDYASRLAKIRFVRDI